MAAKSFPGRWLLDWLMAPFTAPRDWCVIYEDDAYLALPEHEVSGAWVIVRNLNRRQALRRARRYRQDAEDRPSCLS